MNPRRYELTNLEWSIIQPLLPNKPRGVPRSDARMVLNGIYWRLRTGSPWADIPERYGRRPPVANWLSNRVFASYDAIVDHCCHAWNRLAEQPWRVMSIGLRDWAAGQAQ